MYWLFKSEPGDYSYDDLVKEGRAAWDGVKGFQAVANIKKIQPGDGVFFYHTGKGRSIVAVAEAVTEAYEHSTGFTVVDVVPQYPLVRPVSLKEVKADPFFADWELVRQPRLSVMPVKEEYWDRVLAMAGNK